MTQLFTGGWPETLKEKLESYPVTYNSCMDVVRQEIRKKTRNIILIQPASSVVAGKLDNSKKSLLRSIEQGYADACHHSELNSFSIGGSPSKE
jgi:hypothetical protein